jgi:hypothetical protein
VLEIQKKVVMQSEGQIFVLGVNLQPTRKAASSEQVGRLGGVGEALQ